MLAGKENCQKPVYCLGLKKVQSIVTSTHHKLRKHSKEAMENHSLLFFFIFPLCYVQIPKESRRGLGQKVRGQKRIWLIAIDYHAATGTAGMGYRGD